MRLNKIRRDIASAMFKRGMVVQCLNDASTSGLQQTESLVKLMMGGPGGGKRGIKGRRVECKISEPMSQVGRCTRRKQSRQEYGEGACGGWLGMNEGAGGVRDEGGVEGVLVGKKKGEVGVEGGEGGEAVGGVGEGGKAGGGRGGTVGACAMVAGKSVEEVSG